MKTNATTLLLLTLLMALAQSALASNTWQVDGVNGNDKNDCKLPQTACKTIGHAISVASSGDSILVAPAIYTENLTISFSVTVIGAGASTTVIDGEGAGRVVGITSQNAHVTLSKLDIRNGLAPGAGGGILSSGTLTINDCTVENNLAKGQYGSSGGGIYSTGSLTIYSSTISNNGAFFGRGGGFTPKGA